MQEAIDRVSGAGFVHVSLDLDALDPEIAPGVGTPVKGGLTYREAHLACELLAEAGLVGSLELVEVNPILDRENGSAATRRRARRERAGAVDPLMGLTPKGSVPRQRPRTQDLSPQRRAESVLATRTRDRPLRGQSLSTWPNAMSCSSRSWMPNSRVPHGVS